MKAPMPGKKFKVLFLAGWYPNKDHPISGIFIKRHAEVISKYCELAVLYIHDNITQKVTTIEYSIEEGIKTVRVYPRSAQIKNLKIKLLINKFFFQNFFLCSYNGMKVIKKEFGRPDIIHVNVCIPMGMLAVAFDLFKGIPFIISEHFTGFSQLTKNFLYFFELKVILKRAKYICPVSDSLKKTMEIFFTANKYHVVPNVINTNFFTPKLVKNSQIKKQILHVSTLKDKQKNISGIFFAILELIKFRKDFELHIIGDGDDREYLEKLADQLKIKDKFVFFHGFLNDLMLLEYITNSDFFILNSNYETFSVACAEALSSGVPVVATRCGGPEYYINEELGIIIEKGNMKELVCAMNFMLDNYKDYDPMILHQTIENMFGPDVIGKKIYELYQSIIKM